MNRSSSFNLESLRRAVRPFRLHWFATLRSTNDHAAAMRARRALFAPAIVLAGRQTAGRGRGANAWWSGNARTPGGACVTATFVLPASDRFQPHQVPLIAGLAARAAIDELVAAHHPGVIRLKWPNDLLLSDDRKVAGLLCERIDNIDLIGIGINVNVDPAKMPRSLRAPRGGPGAGSLIELTRSPLPPNDVVSALARHLHARLARPREHHFGQALREYDRHHALPGRRIAVEVAGSDNGNVHGICLGLDRIGRLLLRETSARGTIHRVIAGHVSMR